MVSTDTTYILVLYFLFLSIDLFFSSFCCWLIVICLFSVLLLIVYITIPTAIKYYKITIKINVTKLTKVKMVNIGKFQHFFNPFLFVYWQSSCLFLYDIDFSNFYFDGVNIALKSINPIRERENSDHSPESSDIWSGQK